MFFNLGDTVREVSARVSTPLEMATAAATTSTRESVWVVESFVANGRHFRHYVVRSVQPELMEKRALLKTIKYDPRRLDDAEYIRMLRGRMSRELLTLSHFSPRLPEPIDFFETDNPQDPFTGFGAHQLRISEPVLVQSLLHGSSLARMMEDAGAPPGPADTLLLMLAKVCTFLDELHADGHGYLFANLCPEHVVVDPRDGWEPRFVGCANFRMMREGIAVRDDIDDVTVRRPEPGYAAPEALCGEACDRRSDVYAVGVMLFHLFTGIDPRSLADDLLREHPPEAETMSNDEAYSLAEELSVDMERFCRRNLKGLGLHRAKIRKLLLAATSADPDARPAGPAELREALLDALARSTPLAWAGE